MHISTSGHIIGKGRRPRKEDACGAKTAKNGPIPLWPCNPRQTENGEPCSRQEGGTGIRDGQNRADVYITTGLRAIIRHMPSYKKARKTCALF